MAYARLRSTAKTDNDSVEIRREAGDSEVFIDGTPFWVSDVFSVLHAVDRTVFEETLSEKNRRIEALEEIIANVEKLLAEAEDGRYDHILVEDLQRALDNAKFDLPTKLGSVVKASHKSSPFGPTRREFHLLSNGSWANWADRGVHTPEQLLRDWTDFEVLAGGTD